LRLIYIDKANGWNFKWFRSDALDYKSNSKAIIASFERIL